MAIDVPDAGTAAAPVLVRRAIGNQREESGIHASGRTMPGLEPCPDSTPATSEGSWRVTVTWAQDEPAS